MLNMSAGERSPVSRIEVRTLLSLVAALIAYGFFAQRLLDGVFVVDQPAGALLSALIGTVLIFVVAEIVIAALLDRAPDGAVERDERDDAIAAQAGVWDSAVVAAAVNVMLLQAVLNALYVDRVRSLPTIDLTHLPTLVFWLMTALFLGHLTRLGVTLVRYRL
jgi:hypothetical protein